MNTVPLLAEPLAIFLAGRPDIEAETAEGGGLVYRAFDGDSYIAKADPSDLPDFELEIERDRFTVIGYCVAALASGREGWILGSVHNAEGAHVEFLQRGRDYLRDDAEQRAAELAECYPHLTPAELERPHRTGPDWKSCFYPDPDFLEFSTEAEAQAAADRWNAGRDPAPAWADAETFGTFQPVPLRVGLEYLQAWMTAEALKAAPELAELKAVRQAGRDAVAAAFAAAADIPAAAT